MELQFQVRMNPKLFLRDPEQSELGRNIIQSSIELIHEMGFEHFTFKKLSQQVGTTEASIYRYFENKHRLLVYIVDWFWTWMEYRIVFLTNNMEDPFKKVSTIIRLLSSKDADDPVYTHINKDMLYNIVVMEGSKSYLTRHVTQDNQDQLFKPYKDLCGRIATIFQECNIQYQYPRSLASTLLEMANYQYFFKKNLPSLTDLVDDPDDEKMVAYHEHLVFSSLNNNATQNSA
ncbi:MAG: TetR/AcrR family transcriptional regulator [Flavitalea sp.]